MTRVISIEDLKGLFTKPYGTDAPTKQKWAEFYNENVIFTDPTQETEGLDSYVKAQENIVKIHLNVCHLEKVLLVQEGYCTLTNTYLKNISNQ